MAHIESIHTEGSDNLADLVKGFGDSGQRLLQALYGKLNDTIPKNLQTHTILLSGPTGSGKSLLVAELGNHAGCEIKKIQLGQVVASGGQQAGLVNKLKNIDKTKPSIVWLSDIELYYGVYTMVVKQFMERIKELPFCILVMTTRYPERVTQTIRYSADDHIKIFPLGKSERTHLCAWYMKSKGISGDPKSVVDMVQGDTAAEIFYSLSKELQSDNSLNSMSSSRINSKSVSLDVHWEDIGGLDNVIEELKEVIVWPLKHRDSFVRLGIRPPRGVLLYGPPGTGKTMLAKAIAAEVSANFIPISIPDLIKGEVGESEKALAGMFENAIRSPSILFLDEIEAIFGHREQSGEVGKKLISQLFLEMDSIPEDSNVIILAATNAPDLMDKSILRSGRLDKKILVPRPNRHSRLDILHRYTHHLQLENKDALLEELSEFELSGAEIKAFVRSACYSAIRRNSKVLNLSDFEISKEALAFTDNHNKSF